MAVTRDQPRVLNPKKKLIVATVIADHLGGSVVHITDQTILLYRQGRGQDAISLLKVGFFFVSLTPSNNEKAPKLQPPNPLIATHISNTLATH